MEAVVEAVAEESLQLKEVVLLSVALIANVPPKGSPKGSPQYCEL
jgi:hypothetical protein